VQQLRIPFFLIRREWPGTRLRKEDDSVNSIDWSRSKFPPYSHQKEGIEALVANPYLAVLDEMGMGKTYQLIYAACLMYERQDIDTVLIICPAQVKSVWASPTFSQIVEHSFIKGVIHEFTSRTTAIPNTSRGITWLVCSVEILRQKNHVKTLEILLKDRKTWIIVDESSTISNHEASQTKGVIALRRRGKYRTILNGTPIGNSLLGLYSQFNFLDPAILNFKNFYAFRNHHVRIGGWKNKQVVEYIGVEEIQEKIKPYALRRLKKDCLDLPPKIKAPLIEVRLSEKTWALYTSMREEFIAYLESSDSISIVQSAPVKALRLSQICSGFLGGLQDDLSEETATEEVSSELTDAFLDNLKYRLEQDPQYKLIVWCRFRPEISRLRKRVQEQFPQVRVQVLQGGLSKSDREEAVSLFHPDAPDLQDPALLIGQPQSGRFGLNFTKCSNVDYLSNDYSMLTRSQSEDRVDRPGQKFNVIVQDYIVTGPRGEKTISGIILKALRDHESFATWTCSRWVTALREETHDTF
jgi:SNF2 family DNA or RNA helicase